MSQLSAGYTIGKRGAILLVLVVLTLLALNVSLVIQNRNLRSGDILTRSVALKEGTVVPALSGLDLNGNKITLDYQNDPRKAVMLVFSPRCSYCVDNMPNWQSIAQGLDRTQYRILAVSITTSGLKDYVAQYSLGDVPLIAEVEPKSRVSYEMNVTPQTILIDSNGKVEKIWNGVIQDADRTDVERSLGLKL